MSLGRGRKDVGREMVGNEERKDSKVTLLQHMLACCRDCECNLIEHACEKVQDLLRGTPRKVAKEFSTRY